MQGDEGLFLELTVLFNFKTVPLHLLRYKFKKKDKNQAIRVF